MSAHAFEESGLGSAPFRFARMKERSGTCDHCGTAIKYEFWITDVAGHEFKVGSTCVKKTGDASLTWEVDRKLQAHRRAKLEARIDGAQQFLSKNRELLEQAPHPSAYYAKQGMTLADYADFCFKTSYQSARVKAARLVEDYY